MSRITAIPVFLEKLGAFMEAYGKKFNGHPLVETVDIGTFGTWGEGTPPMARSWCGRSR